MPGLSGLDPALPARRAWAPIAGALLLAALLLKPGQALADPVFPPLSGRVVDAANIIPDDQEAQLAQKLAALETQSHRQLVVATLPDLQGYEISDYGYQLGRAWGIGSKEKNDGALLIVAPKERKVRIEVGYGLEGIVTDGLSSLIIQQTILPKFKAGDMPGGIEAGADALVTQLTLPEDQARIAAAKAQAPPAQGGNVIFPTVFFLFMFFILFVAPMLRRMRGRSGYQPSGLGSVILWSAIDAMASGRSSSSGGGFGGGGGFSGGGGSFGGGGSSGSW